MSSVVHDDMIKYKEVGETSGELVDNVTIEVQVS